MKALAVMCLTMVTIVLGAVAAYQVLPLSEWVVDPSGITLGQVVDHLVSLGFFEAILVTFNAANIWVQLFLIAALFGSLLFAAQIYQTRSGNHCRVTAFVALAFSLLYVATRGFSLSGTARFFQFTVHDGSVFPKNLFRITDTERLLDYYYWVSWSEFIQFLSVPALCVVGLVAAWSVYKAIVLTLGVVRSGGSHPLTDALMLPLYALLALVIAIIAPYRISHLVVPSSDKAIDQESIEQFEQYLKGLHLPKPVVVKLVDWYGSPSNVVNALMDRHGTYVDFVMRRLRK